MADEFREKVFRAVAMIPEERTEILDRLGIIGVVQPPVGMSIDIRINNNDIRWWRMPSSSRAYPMKLETKAAFYRKVF